MEYPAGGGTAFVGVGDFNRDGKLDLATANSTANTISILLGNGDGSFRSPTQQTAGNYPFTVAVGDLNGDTNPDLVVGNTISANFGIYLGRGDGTFQPPAMYVPPSGANASGIALGDFNGDGRLDLASAGTRLAVYLGNGDGTLAAPSLLTAGQKTNSVAVGDVNGDGFLDLVVGNYDSGSVSVLLGNGNGTFRTHVDYATGGTQTPGPSSVLLGDLNHDAKVDVVVGNLWEKSVSVLLGNGDGTFKPQVAFAVPAGVYYASLGDVNGDGHLDALAGSAGSAPPGTLSVLLGRGDGTLGTPVTFATGGGPQGGTVADFNGDGRMDVATPNWGTNNVSILLGCASVPASTCGALGQACCTGNQCNGSALCDQGLCVPLTAVEGLTDEQAATFGQIPYQLTDPSRITLPNGTTLGAAMAASRELIPPTSSKSSTRGRSLVIDGVSYDSPEQLRIRAITKMAERAHYFSNPSNWIHDSDMESAACMVQSGASMTPSVNGRLVCPRQGWLAYIYGGKTPDVRMRPYDTDSHESRCYFAKIQGIDCSGLVFKVANFATPGVVALQNAYAAALGRSGTWAIPGMPPDWALGMVDVLGSATTPQYQTGDVVAWPKHVGIAIVDDTGKVNVISAIGNKGPPTLESESGPESDMCFDNHSGLAPEAFGQTMGPIGQKYGPREIPLEGLRIGIPGHTQALNEPTSVLRLACRDTLNRVIQCVDRVTIVPSTATVQQGRSTTLAVEVLDGKGAPITNLVNRTVTWSSMAPGVASVAAGPASGQGTVTGISQGGPVEIDATVDGVLAHASVTVIQCGPSSSSGCCATPGNVCCADGTQGKGCCGATALLPDKVCCADGVQDSAYKPNDAGMPLYACGTGYGPTCMMRGGPVPPSYACSKSTDQICYMPKWCTAGSYTCQANGQAILCASIEACCGP